MLGSAETLGLALCDVDALGFPCVLYPSAAADDNQCVPLGAAADTLE